MTGNTEAVGFFSDYADDLYELFVVLGREGEWRDSLEELLPYTQEKWVGEDHGNTAEKDQFNAEEEAAALQLMPRFNLQQEVVPPEGRYEQVLIAGGMMRVNRERIGFAKQLLDRQEIEAERIIFWAGQRPRSSGDDAQLETMDLETLSVDDWVREELKKPQGPIWEGPFATEAELSRLAYLENFPHAGLIKAAAARYTFAAIGYPDFTLMDCPAVERPTGLPRPTTNSCAAEWLDTEAPSEEARILVVAGNPHTLRTGKEVQRVADQRSRSDIEFEVCGPAAKPNATIQLYLGEIGRLLYMDEQLPAATAL